MQTIPASQEDVGIVCCIDEISEMMLATSMTNRHKIECMSYNDMNTQAGHHAAAAAGPSPPPPPRPQSKKLSSKLMSSFLRTSFTKRIASSSSPVEEEEDIKNIQHDRAMLASEEAARWLAADDDYFAKRSDGFDELFAKPSLLDWEKDGEAEEDPSPITVVKDDDTTDRKPCMSTHTSSTTSLSAEDVLAREVGHSAHSYLEECFYTEVSVLDRDKFNNVPEVVKSNYSIMGHLGKGSYSDVFEVVVKSGMFGMSVQSSSEGSHNRKPQSAARSRRASLSSSFTVATLGRPTNGNGRQILAMKCLRPQIRSDAEMFTIGAEDLVHETAILAALDHPNIIKLHGRAAGHIGDSFRLSDGFFILLDKLDETLQDRIAQWKGEKQSSLTKQIEVAHTVATAMSYLHSKKILFRDLKPENVGFGSKGVLKLFDLGFACGLPEKSDVNPGCFLFDRCGTPRYMAPEVGLSYGYSLPADVYSFGILLWELCSLSKPFASIKTSREFDRTVFIEGFRPVLNDGWPTVITRLIKNCWSHTPSDRPTMLDVEFALSLAKTKSVTKQVPIKAYRPKRNRRASFIPPSKGSAWY